MQITLKAHAKINLFLDITGRRADGYHTITGVMQAISLCDRVTVTVEEPTEQSSGSDNAMPGRARSIVLTCSDPNLPTDGRNLAWRAAEAFLAATGCGCECLSVGIDKHIPAAAGLAGGSTDAAAVLVALNELFGRPLTTAALCAVGLGLGADVPFCIVGGTQKTEGIGEILTPLVPLPDCDILLACAGEGVSTPAAYRALDDMYGQFAPTAYTPHLTELSALTEGMTAGDPEAVCACTFNIFESAVLPRHTVASAIKETMLEAGAITAMMSGSGPSVFGIFRRGDEALLSARELLSRRGIPTWVCEPMRLARGECEPALCMDKSFLC